VYSYLLSRGYTCIFLHVKYALFYSWPFGDDGNGSSGVTLFPGGYREFNSTHILGVGPQIVKDCNG
jgi:hypothetical protein